MIRKFRKWLTDRFLPMWAKETVLQENKQLRLQVADLQQKLEKKDAYIEGLELGLRYQRRITIHNGEGKK